MTRVWRAVQIRTDLAMDDVRREHLLEFGTRKSRDSFVIKQNHWLEALGHHDIFLVSCDD